MDPTDPVRRGRAHSGAWRDRGRVRRLAPLVCALPLLILATSSAAGAELSGLVFVDGNGNGLRDPGEPARSGVAVSNGLDVVTSDAEGRYALPEGPRGFVFVTRPAGFACESWYRRSEGDFALAAEDARDDFFFVHVSDLHASDRAEEIVAFSGLAGPWWSPRILTAWSTLRRIRRVLVPRFSLDPVADLRAALLPHRDVSGEGDIGVYLAYLDEFRREGSELGRIGAKVAGALEEIAGLEPAFIAATGDLVLDANGSSEEALERQIGLYLRATAATGAPVYSTIGNHELRAIDVPGAASSDPQYGLGFFEAIFGPSYYSFDRGRFHFVVLDTHQPDPADQASWRWRRNRMRDEVKRWLRADLAAHRGRVTVILNHEPFFDDPSWPYESEEEALGNVASDEGIFEELGVDYTLSGHTHFSSSKREGPTTHISTGALSGFFWYLPSDLYPHGYRLFYARGGRLYAAWKVVGRPLVGFVQPAGDPRLYPAGGEALDPLALEGPFDLVAVAADARGPFASIDVTLDGAPLAVERWGDYFARARVDPVQLEEMEGTLVLEAGRAGGGSERAELRIRLAPGGSTETR